MRHLASVTSGGPGHPEEQPSRGKERQLVQKGCRREHHQLDVAQAGTAAIATLRTARTIARVNRSPSPQAHPATHPTKTIIAVNRVIASEILVKSAARSCHQSLGSKKAECWVELDHVYKVLKPYPELQVPLAIPRDGDCVHAEGEGVILMGAAGERREVELTPPPTAAPPSWPEPVCPGATMSSFAGEGLEEPAEPGASPLDEGLERLREGRATPEGRDA
jgi:hypothetical protein